MFGGFDSPGMGQSDFMNGCGQGNPFANEEVYTTITIPDPRQLLELLAAECEAHSNPIGEQIRSYLAQHTNQNPSEAEEMEMAQKFLGYAGLAVQGGLDLNNILPPPILEHFRRGFGAGGNSL